MRDIPAIVEELRNNEAYSSNKFQKDHIKNRNEEDKKQKQDLVTTEDSIDDLWFDMWKVL